MTPRQDLSGSSFQASDSNRSVSELQQEKTDRHSARSATVHVRIEVAPKHGGTREMQSRHPVSGSNGVHKEIKDN